MSEWAGEQQLISSSCQRTRMWDRGVQNLEYVLQQMHTALMALTSSEANDIVANSWKNPLEGLEFCWMARRLGTNA